MSLWSVLAPLASDTLVILEPHWESSGIYFCFPVSALDLQGLPFHMLQQFTDGVDVGVGQLKVLDLGLGGN